MQVSNLDIYQFRPAPTVMALFSLALIEEGRHTVFNLQSELLYYILCSRCGFVLFIHGSREYLSSWLYVYDVFSLVHLSVPVKASVVVRTASLNQRVRCVTRRQTVRKNACVQVSPHSAPSQLPRKTSPSAVRARVSVWTGWGAHTHPPRQTVTQHAFSVTQQCKGCNLRFQLSSKVLKEIEVWTRDWTF